MTAGRLPAAAGVTAAAELPPELPPAAPELVMPVGDACALGRVIPAVLPPPVAAAGGAVSPPAVGPPLGAAGA